MNRRVLSDLFFIEHPGDFLHEVLVFCELEDTSPEGLITTRAYDTALRLYQGRLAGYLACDTPYHDFVHAAETFLAMARLLHGARLASEPLGPRDFTVGLTAAIFHDAGYIRALGDAGDNGAAYRHVHELRSMDFVAHQGGALGLEAEDIEDCRCMIRGTIMAEDVNAMSFRSRTQELLVRMLSAADLLAQLSSATYLEGLTSLHAEDRASPNPHYEDILDCYHKAIAFDDLARIRLQRHLEQAGTFLTRHFSARWNTATDLYRVSMDRQISFLARIVPRKGFDPRRHLRRWGSLHDMQKRMADSQDS